MQQGGEAAETIEHGTGQLQHPLAAHAGAQQQSQQFGVRQACGAMLQQLFARSGIGRKLLDRHQGLAAGWYGKAGG
jgi:hypothetical protein